MSERYAVVHNKQIIGKYHFYDDAMHGMEDYHSVLPLRECANVRIVDLRDPFDVRKYIPGYHA